MVAWPTWKVSLIAALLTVALAAFILGLTLGLIQPDEPVEVPTPQPVRQRQSPHRIRSVIGRYRYATVLSATHACSTIGTDLLARHGGTAVDVAIATQFCCGLVLAYGSGIGGGMFITIYQPPKNSKDKDMQTILAREVAPLASNETMFADHPNPRASRIGGLSVGVPGEVAGLYAAWRRYGRLPWAELVMPSVRLLEEGVPIEPFPSRVIRDSETAIRETPGLRSLFVKADGSLRQEGDRYWNDNLLKTLRTIAEDPASFYSGDLARDIAADIQDAGGVVTEDDLAQYRTRLRSPLRTLLSTQSLQVYSPAPPSSGVVIQFILRVLEEFGMDESNIADLKSKTLTYHRFIETLKFAFAKRSTLGDEEFEDVQEIITKMMSEDYIREIRNKIMDNRTHGMSYYEPHFDNVNDEGTNQISIIAPDGSAVSLTSTINARFGSHVVGNRTGIIFNNEMDDFSTPGTSNLAGIPAFRANFIKPGKMPMSSMSPSIILDENGNVVHVTGATGGPRIISAISHVALYNLFLGERLDAAVNAPRVHHQLAPDNVYYEKALPEEVLDGLRRLGHNKQSMAKFNGIVEAIHNTCPRCGRGCDPNTCIHAVADGRKGGVPDGF